MLTVTNLDFSYQDKKVLKNINFNVKPGSHFAILGESGCGKSTLLKLIYGLLDATEGSLTWNETKITGPNYNLVPGMDFIKYQAQDFDLMPYTSVAENVGKFLSNINPSAKVNRIKLLLEIVEMSEYANTKTQFLSGGQMQRVALAKALANEPEIILLDEPFSHIDTFRKNSLSRNIFRYLKDKGITCIVATHDCIDSLGFADELMVMRNGEIVTIGNPLDVYYNPKQHYVASLFGDVNEIKVCDILEVEESLNKTIYKHPNQLIIVDKAKLIAVVKRCFFEGGSYLIEAISKTNNQIIYIQHKSIIDIGTEINIALK